MARLQAFSGYFLTNFAVSPTLRLIASDIPEFTSKTYCAGLFGKKIFGYVLAETDFSICTTFQSAPIQIISIGKNIFFIQNP